MLEAIAIHLLCAGGAQKVDDSAYVHDLYGNGNSSGGAAPAERNGGG